MKSDIYISNFKDLAIVSRFQVSKRMCDFVDTEASEFLARMNKTNLKIFLPTKSFRLFDMRSKEKSRVGEISLIVRMHFHHFYEMDKCFKLQLFTSFANILFLQRLFSR